MRFANLETIDKGFDEDGDEIEFFTTVRYVYDQKRTFNCNSRVNKALITTKFD